MNRLKDVLLSYFSKHYPSNNFEFKEFYDVRNEHFDMRLYVNGKPTDLIFLKQTLNLKSSEREFPIALVRILPFIKII